MNTLWRRFRKWFLGGEAPELIARHIPRIIPRREHTISRGRIPEHVLKVLYRLHKNGFSAYLVGGGVRDLLLGKFPKDFDIATNATPEQVRKLFRNSRIIGRRFKLVHVTFGSEVVEVATFRAAHEITEDEMHAKMSETGLLLRDNVYGTLEQDAFRRDFTVNALYYNIADFSIVDYVHGLMDLNDNVLRIIGDPEKRYREDPVRMLRAIRFASKLHFSLAPETAAPITRMAPLLHEVSEARLFDEVLKLFYSGAAVRAFEQLLEYQLIAILFPGLEASIRREPHVCEQFILAVCRSTDARIQAEKPTTAAFLFASLLWKPLVHRRRESAEKGDFVAYEEAANQVFRLQCQKIGIPKRVQQNIRDIWRMQLRLQKQMKKAMHLMYEPLFRAAVDFFLLRAEVEPEIRKQAQWWKNFMDAELTQKELLLSQLPKQSASKRRFRKKKSHD